MPNANQQKTVAQLERQRRERDLVLSELLIANRILRLLIGKPILNSSTHKLLETELKSQPEVRPKEVLKAIGISPSEWHSLQQ